MAFSDEELDEMVNHDRAKKAAMALVSAALVPNDPEDTLFLQITARESLLIAAGLTMIAAMKGPVANLYSKDITDFLRKIGEATDAQKVSGFPDQDGGVLG